MPAFVVALAQQLPTTAQEFRQASSETRRAVVVEIIEHRSTLPVEEMVAIIVIVLTDPDPVMREAALSAIVSRTSVQDTSIDLKAQNGHQQGAALMKGLRPQVEDVIACHPTRFCASRLVLA